MVQSLTGSTLQPKYSPSDGLARGRVGLMGYCRGWGYYAFPPAMLTSGVKGGSFELGCAPKGKATVQQA